MPISFISGWSEIHEGLKDFIISPQSDFVGRMGGSDTDAVVDWLIGKSAGNKSAGDAAIKHLSRIKAFNGYYDIDNNDDKFVRFIDLLYNCYVESQNLSFVDAKLLSMFFPESLNHQFLLKTVPNRIGFQSLVDCVSSAKNTVKVYPYTFYQTLGGQKNLFRVFEETLSGKKVLAITPFSKSIMANWNNRKHFIKNYKYPEFEIATLNTPITYDGLPENFYPHRDWFQTLKSLYREVEAIEFDIALLSCGSYAMPLGHYISRTRSRKAIYVGGVLQLLFGIFGRRYDNPFFLEFINKDSFIVPLEKAEIFQHVSVREDSPHEHFGAYF